jgi:hypothetical protein
MTDRIRLLLAEASDSFKAYAVSGHRHHPETVQELQSRRPCPRAVSPHLLLLDLPCRRRRAHSHPADPTRRSSHPIVVLTT